MRRPAERTAAPPAAAVPAEEASRTALSAVVADDLSGAAEVAGALLLRRRPCTVLLQAPPAGSAAGARGTVVVDLDHRAAEPAAAHAAVTAAVSALTSGGSPGGGLLAVKLDSLWRGNVGATVRALRDQGFTVVVAGALPALRRSVVDGVPLVDGTALARTDLWHLEPRPAPERVADLLAGAGPVLEVGLATVRSPGLARVLARSTAGGSSVVADAESEDDLAAIAVAAVELVAHGHPAADPLVLRLDGTHADPRAAVVRLAERAVALVGARDLVLTGGETARAVLTRLGVDTLRPVAQLSHGAVVSVTADGRLVATKPGSFGGPGELHELVRLLHRLRAAAPAREDARAHLEAL
ncbi:four-carbon acid sugar kinase family protein [Kineococcus indalonis]|uniref:four-carbon acid sugar kinase family protein n=1 Tax=Kineococcus indalonis TaxID=2696566 RepID=UPI00196A8244|nr:four-carbon acid sugar kinase family protein [Kineococcus indalonis]